MSNPNGIDRLINECRLIVTAGCGGVGKTTVAASIALRAAESGRRVAVLTVDPARRLAQALGIDAFRASMSQIPLDPSCSGRLDVMMVDMKHTGDALVHRFAPSTDAAHRILNNRYYKFFSTSLAGSLEYMAIEEVRQLMSNGAHDLVVLDTPPATHALDFLDAPGRMIDGLERIPMQVISGMSAAERGITGRLVKQGRHLVLKGLNRLTGGPFLQDLAEFLGEFHGILEALRDASRKVETLLRESSTQFLLVTIPTANRVDEALAFRSELEKRQLPLWGFILNRLHTPIGESVPVIDIDSLADTIHRSTGIEFDECDVQAVRADLEDTWYEHHIMVQRDRQMRLKLEEFSGNTLLTIPRFSSGVNDLVGLRQVASSLASED